MEVGLLDWLRLKVGQIDVLVAPLAREVLADKGIVEDVASAVEQQLKIDVDSERIDESALVVNFVIRAIAQRQQRVSLASEAQP